MAASLADMIKQLTDSQSIGVQPSSTLFSALESIQNSPYKFSDWATQQGYTYQYDANTKVHKLNNVALPDTANQLLTSDYAPEKTYQNIIKQYQDMVTAQQTQLTQAQTQAATPATTTQTTPTAPAEEGQYVSPYQEQINALMGQLNDITPYETPEELKQYLYQLLQSANQPFSYDAAQDSALQMAQSEAGRVVREGAGAKGTLYSSATLSNVAKQQGSLIPEYEMKAYQRYADQKNREVSMMTTLMQWDELQANRYYDQVELVKTKFDYILQLDSQNFERFQVMLEQQNFQKEYQLQQQQLQLERQMAEIDQAYKKVDALGYVDNASSVILGLPVGTKAQWVKEIELANKKELERMKIEYDNNVKLQKSQATIEKSLIAYRNSLEEAAKKKLMEKQYAYDKKLLEYQHKLEMGGSVEKGTGVVAVAQANMGIKYVYGGNSTTTGMDCSSFTQYVMKQNGVSISRTAADQAKGGSAVSKSNLQPGDLVFFNTIAGNGKNVDHVGIYIGNGQMIHNSSSKGKVVQVNMNTEYWNTRYTTARRYNVVGGTASRGSSSGGSSSSGGGGSVGRNSSKLSTAKLQSYMKQLGYYSGKLDGKYGPATTAAVKEFQRAMGIAVDGNFGPQSYSTLNKHYASKLK